MNFDQKVALQLGSQQLQIIQQSEQLEAQSANMLRTYELLAQCIRSGQIPEECVPGLLKEDSAFAAWYQASGSLK